MEREKETKDFEIQIKIIKFNMKLRFQTHFRLIEDPSILTSTPIFCLTGIFDDQKKYRSCLPKNGYKILNWASKSSKLFDYTSDDITYSPYYSKWFVIFDKTLYSLETDNNFVRENKLKKFKVDIGNYKCTRKIASVGKYLLISTNSGVQLLQKKEFYGKKIFETSLFFSKNKV